MRKIVVPRIRGNPEALAHCGAAACIRVLAWRGIPALIALSAIIPPLIFSQRSRVEAFLVAFAYYAAASWPLTLRDYALQNWEEERAFLKDRLSALEGVAWGVIDAADEAPWDPAMTAVRHAVDRLAEELRREQ